ncbi:MAG: hypothetical protein ACLPYB_13495 [Desulfobaccales bacterium]
MKKIIIFIIFVVFGMVAFAYAQSAKEVYLAVKKAELKSTGTESDVDNAIADARAEFDLFKDSKEALKNPEFTKHIDAALNALRVATFSERVKNSPAEWKENMDWATRELEQAKHFLK